MSFNRLSPPTPTGRELFCGPLIWLLLKYLANDVNEKIVYNFEGQRKSRKSSSVVCSQHHTTHRRWADEMHHQWSDRFLVEISSNPPSIALLFCLSTNDYCGGNKYSPNMVLIFSLMFSICFSLFHAPPSQVSRMWCMASSSRAARIFHKKKYTKYVVDSLRWRSRQIQENASPLIGFHCLSIFQCDKMFMQS